MSTILSPRKRVGLTQFRSVLLASAAAAALCLSPARPAQADCSFLRASQEIICTGDVSDGANFWQLPGGVKIATDYTKLTVHDVTGDITPAPGRRGVALDQASFLSIEVDSNVTPYRFVTTGDGAPGVYGFSLFDVTVRNTGDVVTSGQHSDAVVSNTFWGVAKVVNTGNLSTAGDDSNGIYAASGYGTVVSVVSRGISRRWGRDHPPSAPCCRPTRSPTSTMWWSPPRAASQPAATTPMASTRAPPAGAKFQARAPSPPRGRA